MGEGMPGLTMMGKMEAVVDARQRQKAHLRHVEDSHRQGMEALRIATGMTTEPIEPAGEDDDMGDQFSVSGDSTTTTHNHYYPPAQPESPSSPSPMPSATTEAKPESEPAWKTWLKRAALVGLPALAGAGGVAGYNALTVPEEKPPAVEQPAYTDSYMEYGVEVLPPSE